MENRQGEFDMIARLFAPLAADAPGAYGLTDDAAAIALPPGSELVVTSDTLVAGVHFLEDDPPAAIAAKLLAVNLSDLAAMGAMPQAYTLAAAWPRDIDFAWQESFAAGLANAQAAAGIVLVGGDTVATPGPMTLNITAMGSVETGRALRRCGAQPGDRLFVSGTIGDAFLGLQVLSGTAPAGTTPAQRDAMVERYRKPTARLALGRAVADIATAAIDISDGLLADLGHVAEHSKVQFNIDATRVPLSEAARQACDNDQALLGRLLNGGDDYELAFTVPETAAEAVHDVAATLDVIVTEIGTAAEGEGGQVICHGADGRIVGANDGGYRHF